MSTLPPSLFQEFVSKMTSGLGDFFILFCFVCLVFGGDRSMEKVVDRVIDRWNK